jgi:hypothetical protein
MRIEKTVIPLLLCVLGGCEASSDPPQGMWSLSVCQGTASRGSTCALLDQTRRLRVKFALGGPDVGRVLFDADISPQESRQLFNEALSVVRSFSIKSATSITSDSNFFVVQIDASGAKGSAWFNSVKPPADDTPAIRGLAEHLARITHAF